MDIDFSPLNKAIQQLEKSLSYATSEIAKNDAGLFEQLRNSLIQCFEFTYELSHKMLKRHLEASAASPEEIDFSSFQNIVRTGNEKGLLRSDWPRWKAYLKREPTAATPTTKQKPRRCMKSRPTFLTKRASYTRS